MKEVWLLVRIVRSWKLESGEGQHLFGRPEWRPPAQLRRRPNAPEYLRRLSLHNQPSELNCK